MMTRFDESTVESAALDWLGNIGYRTGYAPVDAAVGEERESPADCILWNRLANALLRLNPGISTETLHSAIARIQRAESQDLADGVTL